MNGKNRKKLTYVVIFLALSLSIFLNYRYSRPHAYDFESHLGIPSEFRKPKDEDIIKTATSSQSFMIDSATSTRPLFLKFYFSCPNSCGRFWLEYTDSNQRRRELLIAHPIFNQLKWPYLEEGEYSLYQSSVDFKSINEFINNPNQDLIASDAYARSYLLAPYANTTNVTNVFNSPPKYIYTNFKKPRIFEDNWYEFVRLVDFDVTNGTASAILHHPDWQIHPVELTTPELL
jgi:hypothetical protein